MRSSRTMSDTINGGESVQHASDLPPEVIGKALDIQATISTVCAVEYLRSLNVDYLKIERLLLRELRK